MLSKMIEIRNTIGLHARPAAMLAAKAAKYRSSIRIRQGRYSADVKNSVRVLAMAINAGDTIELIVSGTDEETAFDQVNKLFDRINGNNC
jgi:phosphocarrier protein